MKTSVNDFFHSVCGGLLLLEIAHICDNDVLLASCAFSTMKYVLGNLLTLHRPICEKLVQWITPFVAVPSLSENASSVISSLKLLIVDQYIEEESKECTDIDSSSMVVGILQDLIDHFPQLPIKACNLVLKVGISVIKDLSDSKVPSKLRFLCIRDEGRLVKLCSIDLNSGDTNYQTLENDHKFPWFKEIVREAELRPYLCIFRKFPELLSACTAYLVALYLRVKPFSISNLDQVDLVIISEGIKIYQVYYNGRSHPYQLCQTLRLGSHVHELFWLEVMEAETKDLSRYCTVFSNLHEEDYKDFTLLYRPISSLKSGTCNADILDESLFGDSLLMSQRWSCEDIPQDFDATRMVNEMYCTLREYILNPRVNSPWYDGDDQFIRLACLCAQATIDKEKCEDLIKYSLRMFTDTKKDHNGLVIMRQVLTNCWENLGCPDVKVIADVCEATALWHSDQQERAVHCMRQAAEYIDRAPLIFREVETTALLKGAKYTWKLRCGTFAQIRKKFIDKICFSDNESSRLYPKVHDLIAQFHDEQYQSTLKAGLIQTRRKLLETLRNELKSAPPNSDYVKGIERHLRQDELELERLIADKRHYAVHAAINYMKAITQGDRYDLKVFRLVSLWLSFRKLLPMNDVFNGEFPAYKFIPVMYQIASRLDSSDSCVLFQERLQLLLQRILSDHPYHCLPHLLALRRNANTMTAGTKRRLVTGSSPQERRALAAEQLISTGKCQKPYLREIIGDTEKLWQAYLEMATTELSPGTSTKVIHPFESRWSVKKIRNLKAAVITRNIPVSPSGIYDDAVKVDMFCHDGYRVVGGINIPKIVDCQGSDGLHYRQLVKGKDDVRQDAVMEQVFCLLNRILAESSETQRRNLSLRTYRVVPLMPLAGVLEWVNNATPIGDYLTIAHQKINPQDITPKEARSIMKGEFERTDSNPLSKQKTFIESICSKFNPVFRYFFLESTLSVQGWFQMRLKYTRSTAVGSMIGYVVGLGDRHCQNIMIDRLSGELIHIDLNMIFELGKHLRIPETVPFRLTRDIVDGLGYAGLEAGFSSNATQVMTVLRTKMEIIIMLMEAFKHDPLQRWSLNAGAEQSGELDLDEDEASSASTKDADRALLRIREKLIGIEDGTILSERGQVLFLIQMATNEELLAQMYHGWQPWM